jgi:acyl dehydratase
MTSYRLDEMPALAASAFRMSDSRMGVNYGLNRVRFPVSVPVGSRLRAHFTLLHCQPCKGWVQITTEVRIARQGADKPVCVAETLSRRLR